MTNAQMEQIIVHFIHGGATSIDPFEKLYTYAVKKDDPVALCVAAMIVSGTSFSVRATHSPLCVQLCGPLFIYFSCRW